MFKLQPRLPGLCVAHARLRAYIETSKISSNDLLMYSSRRLYNKKMYPDFPVKNTNLCWWCVWRWGENHLVNMQSNET